MLVPASADFRPVFINMYYTASKTKTVSVRLFLHHKHLENESESEEQLQSYSYSPVTAFFHAVEGS